MFKVFKLNDDKFVILMPSGLTIEGTKVQTMDTLYYLDVHPEEISYCFKLLVIEDNDVVDFGLGLQDESSLERQGPKITYGEKLFKKSAQVFTPYLP